MFTKKLSWLPFVLPGLLGLLLFYALPFLGGMFFSLVCAPRVWALSFVLAGLLNRTKPAGGFSGAALFCPT